MQIFSQRAINNCLITSIAAASLAVYTLYEIIKWALNGLADFFYKVYENLLDYAKSGLKEGCKITLVFFEYVANESDTICHVVSPFFQNGKVYLKSGWNESCKLGREGTTSFLECACIPLLQNSKIFVKESGTYLISGCGEGYKFLIESPNAADEIFVYPRLLAKMIIENVEAFVRSGASESGKIFHEGIDHAAKLLGELISTLQASCRFTFETASSGCKQMLTMICASPHSIDEATCPVRNSVKAIVLNLCEYLDAGKNQLLLMIEAGLPILTHFLRLSKEAIFEVTLCLIEYLIAGGREFKKWPLGSLEAIEEGTVLLRELSLTIATEMYALIFSGCLEGKKHLFEAPNTLHEGVIPLHSLAKAALANLLEYISAANAEKTKVIIEAGNQIEECIHGPIVALMEAITLEVITYLSAAAKENSKLFQSLVESVEEGTTLPRQITYETAQTIFSMLAAGRAEIIKEFVGISESALEDMQIPFEFIKAVCENVFSYLKSADRECALWALLLKEDLPDTFRILVQKPLENFFRPKWRALKQKVTAWNEARKQRMQQIRAEVRLKMAEIQDAVREKIAKWR